MARVKDAGCRKQHGQRKQRQQPSVRPRRRGTPSTDATTSAEDESESPQVVVAPCELSDALTLPRAPRTGALTDFGECHLGGRGRTELTKEVLGSESHACCSGRAQALRFLLSAKRTARYPASRAVPLPGCDHRPAPLRTKRHLDVTELLATAVPNGDRCRALADGIASPY